MRVSSLSDIVGVRVEGVGSGGAPLTGERLWRSGGCWMSTAW